MINIIYGKKGSGKTKEILERANERVCDGNKVFITYDDRYMLNLNHGVRFVNAVEYDIASEQGLLGFIRGLIAANNDIRQIYIDGAHKICLEEYSEMSRFFERIVYYAEKFDLDITLTVSLGEDEMPDFIKKLI